MAGKKFFVEGRSAVAVAYDTPRPMTAGSAVLNLKSRSVSPIRQALPWQTCAWDYVDQIGELKYAFGLISQLVSRAAIFAGVNYNDTEVPAAGAHYLERFADTPGIQPNVMADAVQVADEIMAEITNKAEIMRLLAQNYAVAGECYLHNIGDWSVASVSEFKPGTPPKFNKHKDSGRSISAPKGAYVARLWRAHPRWSGEADSSMLGVLDQCVDEATEIFTSRGWLSADEVVVGDETLTLDHDTGVAEWQPITDFTYRQVVDEPMLRMTGKLHDSLTTMGHRWPVVDQKDQRVWRTSETLSASDKMIMVAPTADLPIKAQYAACEEGTVEAYTGIVWCPTTVNGSWLMRRKGKISYTGNCEKLVLFDQVTRSVSRSRLGAGIVFIPAGLTPASGDSIEEAIAKVTVEPVEDEAARGTVSPLLLTGPIEIADYVKRLELGRTIDPEMTHQAEISLNRLLDGIDIPKNVVSGFEGSRYAVAVVVDDSLYKAHIEPLIMLICDSLTTAYLGPLMRKRGVAENLIKKFVVWYDPVKIVTRPDKSQSANEGFDRYLLSGAAWRTARGYSEEDKPSEDELLIRVALDKAQVPPDVAQTLIENLNRDFFDKARSKGRADAGVPSDIQSLLDGSGPATTPPPAPTNPPREPAVAKPDAVAPGTTETVTRTNEASGGAINDNSSQPPSPLSR